MFASRHTSKIDRPPSACLKIRILSSVLYFLPFIRLVPFGPDYLIPRLEKAQSRQPTNFRNSLSSSRTNGESQPRPLDLTKRETSRVWLAVRIAPTEVRRNF